MTIDSYALARMAFPEVVSRDFTAFTKLMTQTAMRDYWFDAETLAAIDAHTIPGWQHIGAFLICDADGNRFVWRLTGERTRNDDGTVRAAHAMWPD